jgi:hypothetical protein
VYCKKFEFIKIIKDEYFDFCLEIHIKGLVAWFG